MSKAKKNDEQTAPQGLNEKLWAVLEDCASLEKDGAFRVYDAKSKNWQERYKFVSHDQVIAAVSKAFRKYRLRTSVTNLDRIETMTGASDRSGNPVVRVVVRNRYTTTCLDTGEAEVEEWVGEGIDTQDKATPKAHTQCKKTYYLAKFLICTGDQSTDADYGHGQEEYGKHDRQNAVGRTSPKRPSNPPELEVSPKRKALNLAIKEAINKYEIKNKKGNTDLAALATTISMVPGLGSFDPDRPGFTHWTDDQVESLLNYYLSEVADEDDEANAAPSGDGEVNEEDIPWES